MQNYLHYTTIIWSVFISSIVSIIFWYLQFKITHSRKQKDFKLKLLNELYSCIQTVSHCQDLENYDTFQKDIENSIAKLGFNIQLYFPNLYNDTYENFIEKTLLLKHEIYKMNINKSLNKQNHIKQITSPRIVEFIQLTHKMYNMIILEVKKYK